VEQDCGVLPNPLTELDLDNLRERRSLKWTMYPPDVLPMWIAEMDTPLARPITDALHAAVERGDTGYESAGQLPGTYAEFSANRFGWRPDPAKIRLVPDVMHGIVADLRLLTRPGNGVVINPPVYHPFFSYLRLAERRIVECPLDVDADGRWSLDLDRLAHCFADPGVAAYLLCNPHNPTGTVFSRAELTAVVELAARYDVRVLVDEIHAPLVLPGATHVPYLSLPGAGQAVAFASASKAWNLAGLKSALTIAGAEVAPALERQPEEAFFGSGIFGVIANEAAFGQGKPWLDALISGLDANRHLLGSLLESSLPGVRYRVPDATFLAWLDCRALDLPDDPAAVFLEKGRVAVNSGPMFGAPGAGYVRLNFATAPAHLVEGVNRMATALAG
jgi:cysteine-S-conjugate beta-lyase